jgi:hypothetical protein
MKILKYKRLAEVPGVAREIQYIILDILKNGGLLVSF